jgi:hypothetical protein
MNNRNLHFRGQMEDEEVMAFSRKHWATIVPDAGQILFFSCAVYFIFWILNKYALLDTDQIFFQPLIIAAVVGCGYMIHRFFLHMIRYFLNVVIITNLRVVEIKKTIFLRDIKESIDIKKIQDVDFKLEGLIKNLLKFGDIHITLGNSEVKTITQIPNPDFHFRLINRLKNEVFLRQQRPLDMPAANMPAQDNGLRQSPAAVLNETGEHLLYKLAHSDEFNSEE